MNLPEINPECILRIFIPKYFLLMKLNYNLFVTILLLSNFSFSQIQNEVPPPENIKSIVFKSDKEGDQFPIVKIGEIFLKKKIIIMKLNIAITTGLLPNY